MKNIHVLPTDKPSRLFIDNDDKKLRLFKELSVSKYCKNQHIYITSDEEIKEGDCFLSTLNSTIDKCEDIISQKNVNLSSWLKKIILTTDQDLIKYGVQAIDDEFLEWFVKNPSCDEVEVEKVECQMWSLIGCNKDDVGCCRKPFKGYKIIIPKEEPKQETLEEASREYYKRGQLGFEKAADTEMAFLRGAKWQQERMYSEMDIVLILSKFRDMKMIAFSKWFKKFEKK